MTECVDLLDWIRNRCKAPGNFLSIGGLLDIEDYLETQGWTGLLVRPISQLKSVHRWERRSVDLVYAQMAPDPQFVPCMQENGWILAVTVRNLFDQFLCGKDWPLILLNLEDQNRMLFWGLVHHFQATPRWWVLPEDGHNEEVHQWGVQNGYRPMVIDGFLILERTHA